MSKHGHGSIKLDCAGGCGTTLHRHPCEVKNVGFSVCGSKCRAKVLGEKRSKLTDQLAIAVRTAYLNTGRNLSLICDELGIKRDTLNKRLRKLREQGMDI